MAQRHGRRDDPVESSIIGQSGCAYRDGAVVEEEPERGGRRDLGLRHGLPDGAPDDALQVGADAGVVVRPQLRDGGRRHERRRGHDGGDEQAQLSARHR